MTSGAKRQWKILRLLAIPVLLAAAFFLGWSLRSVYSTEKEYRHIGGSSAVEPKPVKTAAGKAPAAGYATSHYRPPTLRAASDIGNSVGPDGLITPATVNRLQLTETEQVEAQSLINALNKQIETLMRQNLRKDPLRTNARTGANAWQIKSFPKESDAAFAAFRNGMCSLLGNERGGSLADLYPRHEMYAGFGKHDVSFVTGAEVTGSGFKAIPCTIEQYDPVTGKRVLWREGTFDMLRPYLGKVFSVKDVENNETP